MESEKNFNELGNIEIPFLHHGIEGFFAAPQPIKNAVKNPIEFKYLGTRLFEER